jgi:hypothetical protein
MPELLHSGVIPAIRTRHIAQAGKRKFAGLKEVAPVGREVAIFKEIAANFLVWHGSARACWWIVPGRGENWGELADSP